MTRFPSAAHLVSWGRNRPGQKRVRRKSEVEPNAPRNPYLQGALGAAAMACAQNPTICLDARYRRIAARRGPQKANVAIQHSILIAIWDMGTNGCLYNDPVPTTSTDPTPNGRRNKPSANSKPWATTSPSPMPADH